MWYACVGKLAIRQATVQYDLSSDVPANSGWNLLAVTA